MQTAKMSKLRLLTVAIAGGLLLGVVPLAASTEPEVPEGLDVEHLAGKGRAETATAISEARFAAHVPTVYIATGDNFPDALAGGPAAAADGGPILLARRDSLPPTTVDELVRLQPHRIVVLGGSAAISEEVVTQLGFYTEGEVTRLGGKDRYGTAALVARTVFAAADTVYIATGLNWPDALAAGAAAARDGAPLLLVDTQRIPTATGMELSRLKPERIVLVGGLTSVSARVERNLASYASGQVQRLSGADRYDTAVAVSAANFPPGVRSVYVTTGGDFPDALTGVPAAATEDSPVLLLTGGAVPASVERELERLEPHRLVILGGPAAVTPQVRMQLYAILSQ